MREGNARVASPPVSGLHHHSTSATNISTNIAHLDTTLLYPTTTKINPLLDSSAVLGRINSPFLHPWLSTYPSCLKKNVNILVLQYYVFPQSCGKTHRRETDTIYARLSSIRFHSYINVGANAYNYMKINTSTDARSVLSLVLHMFQLCYLKLYYTALIFALDFLKMFRFFIYNSVLSAYSCLSYLFSLSHHISYQCRGSFLFY